MQVQVDIELNQLLKIVKKLSPARLTQLKAAIEKEVKAEKPNKLEELLLNGPTATSKQLEVLLKTEKPSTNGEQNDIG